MLSVEDLLPGTVDVQQSKLALLDEIRKLTDDPAMELLDDKDASRLDRLRPPSSLRVLHAQDLPPLARRPFTEADGTIGRVLLLYPPEQGLSMYDGRDLLRIAAVLQRVTLPDGREVDTSGSAVIFAAMIRSILRDGPLATSGLALGGAAAGAAAGPPAEGGAVRDRRACWSAWSGWRASPAG